MGVVKHQPRVVVEVPVHAEREFGFIVADLEAVGGRASTPVRRSLALSAIALFAVTVILLAYAVRVQKSAECDAT